MSSFKSLGLSEWLVAQMAAIGFKEPTPVQINCIPPILEGEKINYACFFRRYTSSISIRGVIMIIGKDCIGCAKTGSGKTAAFALPILHQLSKDPYGVFALVITPTRYKYQYILHHLPQQAKLIKLTVTIFSFRELAYQIADQFRVFGRHIGLKDAVIVGGVGELQLLVINSHCHL